MADGSSGTPPPDSDDDDVSSSSDDFLRQVAHLPSREPPGEVRSRVGETLGRYRLVRRLGHGSMGVVYEAFDPRLERRVALKLLLSGTIEGKEHLRRFEREAKSAAKMNHPNIAVVYDADEIDGVMFISMELVEGRSLRERLNEACGPLRMAEAVRIAREITRGVVAAHAAGVIHRDIKPANVMLCTGAGVKLLDFGLAKLRGDVDHSGASARSGVVTETSGRVGTPSYMSPEQVRGRSADARSDVFAIGVVLYEMLAGERPFGGRTKMEVLAAILDGTPQRLAHVSPACARILTRCLAKNPEDRFQDASALLAALTATASTSTKATLLRRLAIPAVAAALTVAAWPMHHAPAGPTRSPANGAPAPQPTAVIDLPLPASSSPEAVAAYEVAMHSFRDANWGQAELHLREAIKLDPGLGAAHLRLALVMSYLSFTQPEAQACYREATRLRSSLTTRDHDLLAALEPSWNADPVDMVETARRLASLTERYPLDAELYDLLSVYERFNSPERQLEAARRAVEVDPEYADAWQMIGESLADTDPDGAVAAFARCTTIAPSATDCWSARANLESALGRCADAESHIRRATSDPGASDYAFEVRARLLYTLGKPREAVAEALRQRLARLDASTVAEETLYDSALLAAAYGDFDEAKIKAAEGQELASAQPNLRDHARFAVLLADIELETGRGKAAAAVASDFLSRRDAWQRGMVTEDPTVYLTRIVAQSGALSEAEVRNRRDAWYRAAIPSSAPEKTAFQKAAWSLAYVRGIQRHDEATEALAAWPAGARGSILDDALDASLGRALWLGGKWDEALPYLARTFTRCDRFPSIFATTRSDLLYGRALEERSETGRACEVYEAILERWGQAKPRSVTAEEARRRSTKLGCGHGSEHRVRR